MIGKSCFTAQRLNAAADDPVNALGPASLLQRKVSEAKEVQRGIESLLRVVETLEQILVAQAAQRFLEIDQRLLDVIWNFGKRIAVAESGDAQDVE
jgi:hypothetical protein